MSGAEISIEGPDKYVLRTKGGRKIKTCRTMASAMKAAKPYLEKTGGRSLKVKSARFKYVSAAAAARKAKSRTKAKRRSRKKSRR